MEDDIIFFENGRRHQFFENGSRPQSLVNGRWNELLNKTIHKTTKPICQLGIKYKYQYIWILFEYKAVLNIASKSCNF